MTSSISTYGSCGDFCLKASDGTFVAGRSMEFPFPMGSDVISFAKGEMRSSTAPDGTKGLEWFQKYGFIGINAFGLNGVDQGMNTEGLTYSALSLDQTTYQRIDPAQNDIALEIMDLGSWILGSFASVEEVKKAINHVKVWGKPFPILGAVPGLHFALHDAQGKNLVIEYIDGEATIYDHPLGVLTNDPPLPNQLLNLAKYNHLSPKPAPYNNINGTVLPSAGFGSGMVGLPGDFTRVSRFVRIAKFVQYILPPKNTLEAVGKAIQILNATQIPEGMIVGKLKDTTVYETTRWTTISDLSNKIFYYKPEKDNLYRKIDLKSISFEPGTQYKQLKVQVDSPTFLDVTNMLKV